MQKKIRLTGLDPSTHPLQLDLVNVAGSPLRTNWMDGSIDYGSQFAGVTNSPLDSRAIGLIDSPPVSQTAIDYFSFCLTCLNPPALVDYLSELLVNNYALHSDIRFENPGGSWLCCPGGFGSTISFKLLPGGEWRARVVLPGRATASMSEFSFRSLFDYIVNFADLSITRLDFKADDTEGILDLKVIQSHLREGGYTGFRGGECIESFGGKKAGITVYFGGRKSEMRVRFYDKEAESGIEGAGIRQELQLRGKRAEQAFESIYTNRLERICDYALSRLSGVMMFGERKGKNLDRFVPAEFWIQWQKSLGRSARVEPSVVRKSSVARSMDWLARAASKALAKASLVLSGNEIASTISKMISYGTSRLKDHELAEIEIATENHSPGEFFPFWHSVLVYN